MSKSLIFTVLVFSSALSVIIIHLLRKDRIPVKYAISWLLAAIIVVLVPIIPNLMEHLASLLGFELLSNMFLCLFIVMLIFMTILLTVMIAGQKKKTTLLIQEISILKKIVEDQK